MFIFLALLTNILVANQLILGGSVVVTALTGMDFYAAVFLIPLGDVSLLCLVVYEQHSSVRTPVPLFSSS
jgi:hypothetical protein